MRAGLEEQFRADGFDLGNKSHFTVPPMPAMSAKAMSFASISRMDRSTREIRRTFDHFHSVHEAEYGHFFAESPIEIVNVRLTGVAPTPTIRG